MVALPKGRMGPLGVALGDPKGRVGLFAEALGKREEVLSKVESVAILAQAGTEKKGQPHEFCHCTCGHPFLDSLPLPSPVSPAQPWPSRLPGTAAKPSPVQSSPDNHSKGLESDHQRACRLM